MKRRIAIILSAALFLWFGCDFNLLDSNDDSPVSEKYLIVTTTDYSNGNVACIAVDNFTAKVDLLSIFSDNAVACHDGSVYLLERDGADNIIRIDGASVSAEDVNYQKNIGTSVNIQQIAFISASKAYVTQYGDNKIAIINPSNGKVSGSISLDGTPFLYDSEDIPYMSSAVVVGNKAYIALQRLKMEQGDWGPYPSVADSTGMIVVINTSTDTIVTEIKLEKGNPASLDTCNGNLYVSSTGSWGDPEDGGIEKINCSTDRNEGTVIEESKFGGDITTLVMLSESKGYVAVGTYDDDFNLNTVVKECNPAAGSVGETVESVTDAFGGLAFDGTYLYIGDRSDTDPGVVVIDPSDNKKVAGPIGVGSLPPNALAVLTVKK